MPSLTEDRLTFRFPDGWSASKLDDWSFYGDCAAPGDAVACSSPSKESESIRLISYTVGCMMGRYSLDEPGLIYAHGGNARFDPTQYRTFPADPDGIVPVTEVHWFAADARTAS